MGVYVPAPGPVPRGTRSLGLEATLTDKELQERELKLRSDLVLHFVKINLTEVTARIPEGIHSGNKGIDVPIC